MKSEEQEREAGFYWIFTELEGRWVVAEWIRPFRGVAGEFRWGESFAKEEAVAKVLEQRIEVPKNIPLESGFYIVRMNKSLCILETIQVAEYNKEEDLWYMTAVEDSYENSDIDEILEKVDIKKWEEPKRQGRPGKVEQTVEVGYAPF